jgi:hypothetical protein
MLIPRLAPSSKGNLHEMAKLYVTRVTSRRSSPMRCLLYPRKRASPTSFDLTHCELRPST